MRIPKIAWQFFWVCFATTTIALWFTTYYSMHIFKKQQLKTIVSDTFNRGYLLALKLADYDSTTGYASLDSLCKQVSRNIQTRITIVLPSGLVIADSEADPDTMENHANRPEILSAIRGENASQQRYSTTLKQRMLYVALPVQLYGSDAILRLSVSLKAIRNQEYFFYIRLIGASMILFTVIIIASYLLSQRIINPLNTIRDGAQRFASGDFSIKLPVTASEELGELAQSLNWMAASLDERIRTVTSQRNELNAILTSMSEGVIATDTLERVISINPAAARLLRVNGDAKGKWLSELIRNSDLRNFVKSTLSSNTKQEKTFSLYVNDDELHVNVSGTVLGNDPQKSEGAVFVFNDITRIRKLENLRKEFVSNVSHELRTPLTSIKGFIETIRNGNYTFPSEVSQFLVIVSSKTNQLCSIVDDILTLSSIERDHEYQEIELAEYDLQTVVHDAIRLCNVKASEKDIVIDISRVEPLRFKMNAQMLEQAITNLVDNAIKYSETGKPVSISAALKGKHAVISVNDHGIGIASEHIDRVFERFYRVDKSRSRKCGGTGLGLSIVKNIAVAHAGTVTVQSEPGKGSTFEIMIPVV